MVKLLTLLSLVPILKLMIAVSHCMLSCSAILGVRDLQVFEFFHMYIFMILVRQYVNHTNSSYY